MKAMGFPLVLSAMCLVVPLSAQDRSVVEQGRLEPTRAHRVTLEPGTFDV